MEKSPFHNPLSTVFFSDGSTQLFRVNANDKVIVAVKLEKGTVSTLLNDLPPNFAEEMAKCQHYLWLKEFPATTQIGIGGATDASTWVGEIILPVAMRRATVTVTFTANMLLLGNGALTTATAVAGAIVYDNHLRLILSATSLTALSIYSLFTNVATTLTVSCE